MSGSADRHTACALDLIAVNECIIIPDLNINDYIGVMNIDREVGKSVKDFLADGHANSGGVERKFFIGALCIDLECLCKNQVILKVFAGGRNNNIHVFLHCRTA